MTKKLGFNLFKWTVYGLLLLNTYFFLMTEDTLTAFLDSAAWILLLAAMEWESSSLDKDYDGPWERWAIVGVNVFAYAVILYAWWGYIEEERWLDVANASAWLGVCAVLVWQMYAPGEYEGPEYRVVNAVKIALYGVLVACALTWTIQAEKPLDAIDAWLWLACFAVIELNVFGFDNARQPAAAPATATAEDGGRAGPA